ncbi:MAG: hypothetical protein ACI9LV_000780 [Candidatus Nanohaloarchaea archaeon]|jgi:hypothetical protein
MRTSLDKGMNILSRSPQVSIIMSEKTKIEVTESELKELVEEKAREIVEERNRKESSSEQDISRRGFLKKIGAGTLGLGALSLLPASALNVRTDGFSFYGGQGSSLDFDIDNSGNLQIHGDITDDNLNTIWSSTDQHIPAANIQQGSGSGLDADTVDNSHIFVQASEPSNPAEGDIWFDVS